VNAGVLLAALGLLQVLIAWRSDHALERVDSPLFDEQVERYVGLGIADFFKEEGPNQLGRDREKEVLRIARMAASFRAALSALVVSGFVVGSTGIIILVADPKPSLKGLRLVATFGAAIVAFVFAFLLLLRVSSRDLRVRVTSEYKADGRALKPGLTRYFIRLKSKETLARYLTVATVASVIGIVAVVGVI
jgi:hypothetical protein